MTGRRLVEVDRFLAAKENVVQCVVIVYQWFVSVGTLSKPDAEMPSLLKWMTSTGDEVNQIDSETFQIVKTNEIVRKI